MKSAASIEWECEVDAETERQIEAGLPPWTAACAAVDIVSKRRQSRAHAQAKALPAEWIR